MGLDNDTRGWIMTAISGVACILGSSVICIDVVVRQFPRMQNFKITESNAFLSASLSLSFGVMLFSSLYSMLPQSKRYLQSGGYSPRQAAFMLIGLFIAGVLGIQVLSRVIHKFIPSHIVDCDHTHDEEATKSHLEDAEHGGHNEVEAHRQDNYKTPEPQEDHTHTEQTPLLSQTPSFNHTGPRWTTGDLNRMSEGNNFMTAPNSRRPSGNTRSWSRRLSRMVSTRKHECGEDGPCMGFSDPCGQECFKAVQRRTSSLSRAPAWRQSSGYFRFVPPVPEEDAQHSDLGTRPDTPRSQDQSRRVSDAQIHPRLERSRSSIHHIHHPEHEHERHRQRSSRRHSAHSHHHSVQTDHHHHVPTNAFMSIGLQTSLAIALHKAPEGFITYATNHASPSLGFSVFMALFIHNISEGFAMSLPLYLAINSRFKAILWSSLLGGASQPLGAGVAALWFRLSGDSGHFAPDERVYGGMFAVTAGIMTSVALSLFSESLQMTHNKGTCIAFAFLGMALLGVSSALTA